MVTVQRAIEMLGIPTVVVTVEPEETLQARPPRALCPRSFVAGHSLGRPPDSQGPPKRAGERSADEEVDGARRGA